ncbi:tetratricopeptide repeat protein [Rhodopila sp.]|uniref:tetratricopeptide repeat protein n=1 Tax=Rhodopila sp. TaxID=2480087 RepID=UPI002C688F74|nr:tetratricopeptide repeat protein [Rhodopila sp.]HVZ08054.1 tetratricopeptide repeat protein [Rhodopila sp.]
MVDIFDEINEDLRAERTARLLKKYGWVLVLAAVGIVGGTVGWQVWDRWQANRDMAAAEQYMAAQAAAVTANVPGAPGQSDAIATLERNAATAPEGYKTLSLLRAAGLKANAGDIPGAVQLWDEVARDGTADPLLRDLASLLAVQHQIDKGDPAMLEARLKPLTDPTNAWASLAKEQLALLDLRQGKVDDARTALQSLAESATAPDGVRQRAAALLAGMGDA